MKPKQLISTDRFRRRIVASLSAVITMVLFLSPLRESWSNWSYDWLFRLRPQIDVSSEEVVIVEMDAESEAAFGQISILAWDRKLHAELLRRLTAAQADVVVFDVLFEETTSPTASDLELVNAAKAHGRVVFGAMQVGRRAPTGEIIGTQLQRPLASSIPVEQVGLAEESFGSDRAIRRHFPGGERIPSLAQRAAELTLANPPPAFTDSRWVNYYGDPEKNFMHVSFWRVLSNALPPTLNFSNKVVFVGGRTIIGPTAGSGTEYFPTPFGTRITGVELNATTYLNLRRSDWLNRAPMRVEFWCLAVVGWLIGHWLCGLNRKRAVLAIGLCALATVLLSALLFWQFHFWFPWLFVVAGTLPAGLAISSVLSKAKAPEIEKPSVAIAEPPARLTSVASATAAIPDHTMLRCIGRGGYGEVWLARDAIGSYHAVKVVYRKSFGSDAPFEREFRGMQKYTPISRNHPGWVHVLHVGRNDAQGCFYYIMELGDDESTGQEINPETYKPRSLATDIQKRRRLPAGECVELGIALADALDYLHGQLLVHRDIKPSNVIFVHNQPKFADVGLVTEVQNRDRNVSLLGTEGFMAPEGPGTAAADLYSLGKLLYEASTGRDRRAFPVQPESLVEATPSDLHDRLQRIIEKACQPEPSLRFASAAEMRDELRKLKQPSGGG